MNQSVINVRATAALILFDILQNGRSLSNVLPEKTSGLSPADRGLIQEICFGVSRHYFQLEAIQKKLLKHPVSKKSLLAALLIDIGLYQLSELRIPDHAALNETVSAADTLQISSLKGLINGVLRNFQRQSTHFALTPDNLALWNHPTWMIEKLKHNWPKSWQDILRENNQRPPMTLRVHTGKIQRIDYLRLLNEKNIEARPTHRASTGITLSVPMDVHLLPGFAKGWVSVQDEAAQLCAGLLIPENPMSVLNVLDACAAPGGKTLAMLEQHPELQITALDIDKTRLTRVQENLDRAALNARLLVADAGQVDQWWDGSQFDRILLDAPCSASGVIRRHPDIKLLRKEGDLPALAKTQLTLLTSLWTTLKPGGTLLYTTCSVFPQENSRIIEQFLPGHPDAILCLIDQPWGISMPAGKQFLPKRNGQDGFFYALLKKTERTV